MKSTMRKTKTRSGSLAIAASAAVLLVNLALPHAHAVTIDWVTVGNPGNANDTTGYGAVAAEFQIMKFEFTNSQYAAFLNAIDPEGTNPNGVWDSRMANDNAGTPFDSRGGISQNLTSPAGSKYVARVNMGNKPVNYVSWWDAARVANWLQNGAQVYGSTDSSASAPQNTGAYTLGTLTSGSTVARNGNARYWVPTENEWYKAAFYNPTLNGGSGGYRVYGNGFDESPSIVSANTVGDGSAGGMGNFANFGDAANWNNQTNGYVTTVGTNGGANYYGAFDMSGNLRELTHGTGLPSSNPVVLRGGDWASGNASDASGVSKNWRDARSSTTADAYTGLRLAAVPEPSTWAMAAAGIACAGWGAFRRRRAR